MMMGVTDMGIDGIRTKKVALINFVWFCAEDDERLSFALKTNINVNSKGTREKKIDEKLERSRGLEIRKRRRKKGRNRRQTDTNDCRKTCSWAEESGTATV